MPTYLQLVHQVEHALRLGYLKLGDQLPKVRDVVASLAINPNTVLKAYKELETKGLTAGRPGQGTFIQATLSQVALPELAALRRSLSGWLATADGAGLDEDGIVALFTSALRDFHERRGGSAHPRRRGERRNGGCRMSMNVIEASGLGKRYGSTLGAARVHAGDPRRARGRAGRPERRGQDHAAEPGGRPGGTVRGRRHRARRPARRVAGRAGRHRVRRPGHAAVQEPVRRGHAAPDPQPEPPLRPGIYAEARLAELGIPLNRKAGKLSGGQQAQLALTLALARRPRLLVLDEPVAMLDPVARHDFMATVLTAAADDGVSVLLSSHVLAELERVADYLVLLSRGRVQVAGEVDDLLASHRVLTGPAAEADRYAERPVVHARRAAAQAHLLVRATADDPVPPRLGGAPGRPGRTRPCLPARARRRGAARPGPQQGHPNRRR